MTTPADPIFPAGALLPLTERGGYAPPEHVPAGLRPYSAALAVTPPRAGGDETTATQDTEVKQTQFGADGRVETDAVPIVVTDS
ncbi:hypothetical protein [Actinokineospora sp. NBRC 105648]|uniref:hypothetical protein n=1 Tax=Actinokineospora sp. NBRC 105648 TaxID=3032206 RepID=UPI0024A41BC0|nr:hypothetical protein [Actinokineospora sp. NBRC 105648]GLZ41415.1 hypothetical protein Acsp05_50390 [Actinokineospora sp. NBRC 105648]